MAYSNVVNLKDAIDVYIGKESTIGTATVNGGTWYKMNNHLTNYSYQEVASPVVYAPSKVKGTVDKSRHSAVTDFGAKMYEITLEFVADQSVMNFLMFFCTHDWAGSQNMFPTAFQDSYMHGATNTAVATHRTHTVSILFDKGASNGTDYLFPSCMLSNLSVSFDGGTNGGLGTISATFMTGYGPTLGTVTPSSSTDVGSALNVATDKMIWSATDVTAVGLKDLLMDSWSLNISRTINKVGLQSGADSTDSAGYVPSKWSVGGSFSCKRDTNFKELMDLQAVNNTGHSLTMLIEKNGTAGWEFSAPTVSIENYSIDFADNGFRVNCDYNCLANDANDSVYVLQFTDAGFSSVNLNGAFNTSFDGTSANPPSTA
jgi:hypothetical protein